MKSLVDYLNENKEENKEINFDDLDFTPIENIDELEEIIENSEKDSKDIKKDNKQGFWSKLFKRNNNGNKKGFWLFKEAIDKGDEYRNIGGEPWGIQYTSVSYNNKIVGLISYSLTYKSDLYENNEKTNVPENGNFIRIIDIQTLPGYSGFLKFYFQYIKKVGKDNEKKYITLQTYQESLIGLYSKYGFKLYNNRYREMFVNIAYLKFPTADKKE